MTFFVIIALDPNGRPIATKTIETPDNAASVSAQMPFGSMHAANAYEEQLRAVFGLPRIENKRGQRKRVKCWQTGEIFPSASAAAKRAGVSTSAVTKHLRGGLPDVRGVRYTWIDE